MDSTRRVRALYKCDFCRSQRKQDRIWPGQKCGACENRGLPCGPNTKTRPSTYKKRQASSEPPGSVITPAHHHSLVSASATANLHHQPGGHFIVPFRRDLDFVGRHEELNELESIFDTSTEHRRAALVGFCGVGKSQIAIEFLYRMREKGADQNIIWLSLVHWIRLEEDCEEALTALGLHLDPYGREYASAVLSKWLRGAESGKWFIVIDGIDIIDSNQSGNYSNPSVFEFLESLPRSRSGSILITTRYREQAVRLTGTFNTKLYIQSFETPDALKLLERKMPHDCTDKEERLALLTLIGCLPFSITQSAAYATAKAMSISRYLNCFMWQAIEMLATKMADLRRDCMCQQSVFTTISSVLDNTAQHAPRAYEVLSCMSVLGKEDIPTVLFEVEVDFPTVSDDGVNTLMASSLLQSGSRSDLVSLHPLLQLVMQRRLKDSNTLAEAHEYAMERLLNEFPTNFYADIHSFIVLIPHVTKVLQCNASDEGTKLQKLSLGIAVIRFASSVGDLKLAMRVNKSIGQDIGDGRDQPFDLLINWTKLETTIHGKLGNYQKAEDALLAALGLEDTDDTRHQLVAVLICQNRVSEAERCLPTRGRQHRRLEDLDHTQLSGVLWQDALAALNAEKRSYGIAFQHYREAYETRKEKLGGNHPLTLATRCNVACLMFLQSTVLGTGTQQEAIDVQQEIVNNQVSTLGEKHPSTLASMSVKIAMSYWIGACEGDSLATDLACQEQLCVLRQQCEIHGLRHPNTIASAMNCAAMLLHNGESVKAALLQTRCVKNQTESPTGNVRLELLARERLDKIQQVRVSEGNNFASWFDHSKKQSVQSTHFYP